MRSFFLFISANNFALGYTGGLKLACDDDVRLVLFVIPFVVDARELVVGPIFGVLVAQFGPLFDI